MRIYLYLFVAANTIKVNSFSISIGLFLCLAQQTIYIHMETKDNICKLLLNRFKSSQNVIIMTIVNILKEKKLEENFVYLYVDSY